MLSNNGSLFLKFPETAILELFFQNRGNFAFVIYLSIQEAKENFASLDLSKMTKFILKTMY